MVAENTLCFDKQRVKDALRKCAGNVDDATEFLISRMNSSSVDLPDIEPPTSGSGSHAPLTQGVDRCSPLKTGSKSVTNAYEKLLSVELHVRERGVFLKFTFGPSAEGVHQQEPSVGSATVSCAVESTKTTTAEPKRQKLQASKTAVVGGKKPSNNKPCPCNSGRRYKHCCKLKRTPAPESKRPAIATEHAVMHQLHILDI